MRSPAMSYPVRLGYSGWLRGCESPCLFSDFRYRTPAMMGDYFGGSPLSFRGNTVLDRAFIVADDLDAPLVLPGAGSTLTISEAGPVGVFRSSITSVQQLQAIFRAAGPIPTTTLVGTVNQNATLTTVNTVSQSKPNWEPLRWATISFNYKRPPVLIPRA